MIAKRERSLLRTLLLLGTAALLPLSLVQTASAQVELLGNPEFEDFNAPNFGNNLNTVSIEPWVLGTGNNPNVVRVDGPGGQDYVRGPEIDGSNPGPGIRQHYLDIIDGENDFYQSFTVPICPSLPDQIYGVRGSFSSRADKNGNAVEANGAITIREGVGADGTIVPGPDLSVENLKDRLNWTTLSGDFSLTPGTTYSLVVSMGNNTNFDGSSLKLISTCVDANDNDFTSTPIPIGGGTTASVFSDDDIDGSVPTSTSVDVSLTDVGGLTGATINADGTIDIPAGATAGTYTLTYEICQEGNPTNCDTATVMIEVVAAPALSITKVADDSTDRKPGETITYTYTVTNTGDVNIEDVTVSDVHNGSGALSAITIGVLTNTSGNSSDDSADNDIDVLSPNDSVTFEANYVVTEADVAAGGDITNTATVTGDPVAGLLPATPITADESVSVTPLSVDLTLTKTNTAGVNGEVDQAADTLTFGDATTYVVTVTNNGPDTVTGALVTDNVVEGLTCTATDTVTITGNGVPTGAFTIGDLTGGGITLATLADGESATLTYSCEVN